MTCAASDSCDILCQEKARMTRLFEKYVDENKDANYALPWSDWLEGQELEAAA